MHFLFSQQGFALISHICPQMHIYKSEKHNLCVFLIALHLNKSKQVNMLAYVFCKQLVVLRKKKKYHRIRQT